MTNQRVTLNLEAILEDCDPVIRSRVKNKLHVSLSESDGSKNPRHMKPGGKQVLTTSVKFLKRK